MRVLALALGVLMTIFIFCEWRMPLLKATPGKNNPDGTEQGPARSQRDTNPEQTDQLSDYWFQGKAEISRYDLKQSRYGHIHQGDAVMVFVTEDFLTDKQVKNERYTNPNSVLVLKNNAIRKFTTGIYEYSMMSSVFTPVGNAAFPKTLKTTNTIQEWCGHTFLQTNLKAEQYEVQSHSYFEQEADQVFSLPAVVLEDELFNRVRINPSSLPTGTFDMIPGAMYTRMVHIDPNPVVVNALVKPYKGKDFKGQQLSAYHIEMPSLNRELIIVFENKAPFVIAGWTDSFPAVKGKAPLRTIAKRTHTVVTDYWNQNKPDFLDKRAKLGLKKRG